jgi:hypothetical protein
MKNERERPEDERGGPGSQGERLKSGWEVVGEERAETKNKREETKFGSARSAERFAEAANEGGEAASAGAESRGRGASARLRMPLRGWPCGVVLLGTSV